MHNPSRWSDNTLSYPLQIKVTSEYKWMNLSASHRFSSVPVSARLEDLSSWVVISCCCQVKCKLPSPTSHMGATSNFCQCLANLSKRVLVSQVKVPDTLLCVVWYLVTVMSQDQFERAAQGCLQYTTRGERLLTSITKYCQRGSTTGIQEKLGYLYPQCHSNGGSMWRVRNDLPE